MIFQLVLCTFSVQVDIVVSLNAIKKRRKKREKIKYSVFFIFYSEVEYQCLLTKCDHIVLNRKYSCKALDSL